MPILRLLPPSILSPACHSRLVPPILRRLHNGGGGVPPSAPDLSLLEELFPEEVQKKRCRSPTEGQQHIPRLPLSTLTEENPEGHNVVRGGKHLEALVERDSSRQWNISVLVIRRASRSLIESDFRRIAPKGQHIDDWKGLGDILRVIPAREITTLQQHSHYYLLFPNPAYARAYQSHIISLHRIAKTHTPTSIESPLGPPPGMLIEGENIHDVLQNYALCPPSQKISLRVLFPPYSPAIRRLIDQRGYAQIEVPPAPASEMIQDEQQKKDNSRSRSGRAILIWVQGYNPPLSSIREMINQDGRKRGLAWSLANDVPAIEK
ncbi:hypothetical protein MMC31_006574, partial [Peltigera leucophlebia]|nr:hypothetical protein [Peltigera leucophlebia]